MTPSWTKPSICRAKGVRPIRQAIKVTGTKHSCRTVISTWQKLKSQSWKMNIGKKRSSKMDFLKRSVELIDFKQMNLVVEGS